MFDCVQSTTFLDPGWPHTTERGIYKYWCIANKFRDEVGWFSHDMILSFWMLLLICLIAKILCTSSVLCSLEFKMLEKCKNGIKIWPKYKQNSNPIQIIYIWSFHWMKLVWSKYPMSKMAMTHQLVFMSVLSMKIHGVSYLVLTCLTAFFQTLNNLCLDIK